MGVKVLVRSRSNRKEDEEIGLRMAMRKFKKLCEREGIVREMRKHERYEKPSDIRKKDEHRRKMNVLRAQQEAEGIIRPENNDEDIQNQY